ncbi:MAG TPA: SDR family oxidoreductase [Pyrinomonadaceae bacterium]|jgi:NAD(P)-dependent dehydrogenase (short-subunit alcohol dehydrogenase family)
MKLKPINEQVVCIVGASSGIGRETALRFARRGARLVVAARGAEGLESLVGEIRSAGGEARAVVCDVLHFEEVERVAAAAVEAYGRLDTWVHLAAVSIYAKFEETTPEEFKQVIETNLTGQAYGAMAALPHLRRAGGGALIHVSSVEARRALPYQSAYASSKHGMKGFLEAMRMELAREGVPISVTEVMPSSINTPFFNKARTKLGVKPMGVKPMYQPHLVADAILFAAENAVAEITVGGAGKALAVSQCISPRLTDTVLSLVAFEGQKTDEPKTEAAPDNLFHTLGGDHRVEGDFTHEARETSLYTWLETHPNVKRAVAAGAFGAIALLVGRALKNDRNNNDSHRDRSTRHIISRNDATGTRQPRTRRNVTRELKPWRTADGRRFAEASEGWMLDD